MSKFNTKRAVAVAVAALGMSALPSWGRLPVEIVEKNVDFNADLNSDVVWYHPDGVTGIWLLNGLTITRAAEVTGGPSVSRVVLTGDTGNDGNSDLVWKRTPDNSYWVSIMSGTQVQQTRQLYAQNDGAGQWDVVGKADFNGDHKMDLLWRRADGAYGAWLMDGVSIPAVSFVQSPGSGFQIKALADFNGDGKTDILWQHSDGRIVVSMVGGFTLPTPTAGGQLVITGTTQIADAGSNLSPVRVADFNGDGSADILMSNTDGSQAIWLMNGGVVQSKGTLYQPGNVLVPQQVCDMDGDGKADIIWEDPNDVSYTITLMDGTVIKQSSRIAVGGALGWFLLGHGDYNGDGKADLIWRNVDASYGLWLMNGATITRADVLLHGGTGWEMEDVVR